MFTNRLLVLIVGLALLTVAAITIQAGIATSAVVNANVPHSDYLRDPNGYAAPYVSRSDIIRDASYNAASDPYVSRSDTLRSSTDSLSEATQCQTIFDQDFADRCRAVRIPVSPSTAVYEDPYPPGFELPHVSRSDTLRSGTVKAPYISRSDFLRGLGQ